MGVSYIFHFILNRKNFFQAVKLPVAEFINFSLLVKSKELLYGKEKEGFVLDNDGNLVMYERKI